MRSGISVQWSSTTLSHKVSFIQCHLTKVSDTLHQGRHIDKFSQKFSLIQLLDDTQIDVDNLLVTATHAIFHTEDKKSAPVAVVGYQFQHSALRALFKNTTSNVSLQSV